MLESDGKYLADYPKANLWHPPQNPAKKSAAKYSPSICPKDCTYTHIQCTQIYTPHTQIRAHNAYTQIHTYIYIYTYTQTTHTHTTHKYMHIYTSHTYIIHYIYYTYLSNNKQTNKQTNKNHIIYLTKFIV